MAAIQNGRRVRSNGRGTTSRADERLTIAKRRSRSQHDGFASHELSRNRRFPK